MLAEDMCPSDGPGVPLDEAVDAIESIPSPLGEVAVEL
jgi:hypothetical protein